MAFANATGSIRVKISMENAVLVMKSVVERWRMLKLKKHRPIKIDFVCDSGQRMGFGIWWRVWDQAFDYGLDVYFSAIPWAPLHIEIWWEKV